MLLLAIQLPPIKNPSALPLKFLRNRDTHAGLGLVLFLVHLILQLVQEVAPTPARVRQLVQLSPTMFLLCSGTTHQTLVINPRYYLRNKNCCRNHLSLINKDLDQELRLWSKAHRGYSIFGLSLKEGSLSSEKLDDRSVRESWQTADSLNSTANDLLDGLGLALPHPIKEQKFRASIASISTFMTTDSADAVIPQTPGGEKTPQQSFFKSNIRISTPLSLSDFDVYSDTDDDFSVLDSIQHPISSIPEGPESRPQTPETPAVGDLSLPLSPNSTRPAFNRTLSRTRSAVSCSTTTTSTLSPADSISIKAIHDSCIILLRVSRGLGFAEVRQRLYNKFIGQEGIPLSQAYEVAVVPPSEASAGPCSTLDNRPVVQLVTLESDWEQLVSTLQGDKITLRILDGPTA